MTGIIGENVSNVCIGWFIDILIKEQLEFILSFSPYRMVLKVYFRNIKTSLDNFVHSCTILRANEYLVRPFCSPLLV